MRYPVILEPAPEGGYSVMVPDLPGCFSHGDTYEEAVDHAREAIELHLFSLQEEGLKAPSPRTVKEIREKGIRNSSTPLCKSTSPGWGRVCVASRPAGFR